MYICVWIKWEMRGDSLEEDFQTEDVDVWLANGMIGESEGRTLMAEDVDG